MKQFIGTKIVLATPMARGEYNAYRGWTPPEGEDQAVDGYLVEYQDGGQPNDSRHGGYISWSPKGSFDAAYVETGYDLASKLPAHQQRVMAEKAELVDRVGKLKRFVEGSAVFAGLPVEEQHLLKGQLHYMEGYAEFLAVRIKGFLEAAEGAKKEAVPDATGDEAAV